MDPEIKWTEAPEDNYAIDNEIKHPEGKFPTYSIKDTGSSFLNIHKILLTFRLCSSLGLLTCALLQMSKVHIFIPDDIITTLSYFLMAFSFTLLSICTNRYKKRKNNSNFPTFVVGFYIIAACLSSFQILSMIAVIRSKVRTKGRVVLYLLPLLLYFIDTVVLQSRVRFTYYQGFFVGSIYSIIETILWIIFMKNVRAFLKIGEVGLRFALSLFIHCYLASVAVFLSRLKVEKKSEVR